MNMQPEFLREDSDYRYYRAFFEGKELNILVRKSDEEVFFDASNVANCLGFASEEEMRSTIYN